NGREGDDGVGETGQMIAHRLYQPQADDLIYHYCGADAFLNIVKSQTMWFSATYTLNDYMEQRWGLSVYRQAVSKLAQDVDGAFLENIDPLIEQAYLSSLLLISSYSLDGDVLSQWRAYADGERGFAIGFLAKEMAQMPVKPLRVLYDEERQIDELVGNLRHTFDYERSIGFSYDEQFKSHWYQIALDLCAYKNPAFKEENEVRLAHVAVIARAETPPRIVPAAGLGWGKRVEPGKIQFRTRGDVIIPYMPLDFSN